MSDDDNSHFVVRCRGLPWSTTVDEITNFFEDCVFQEGNDSVHMTTTREGRPSGEAYIELATEEDLEKALAKDKKHMGKRYIEGMRTKNLQNERSQNSEFWIFVEKNIVKMKGVLHCDTWM